MTPEKFVEIFNAFIEEEGITGIQTPDQAKALAECMLAQTMPCGDEKFPLDAYLWRRDSEWVLEISGAINDTSFTVRHPVHATIAPEDVPSLGHLYTRRDAIVEELDFSDIPVNARSKHPKIDRDHKYIILQNGKYHCGKMSPVWFGWNFYQSSGANGVFGSQFDPPGTNGCNVQKVWIVIEDNGLHDPEAILMSAGLDPVDIADRDELRYAAEQRKYCIDHRCTYRGVTITEESPINAWLYKPTAEKMPVPDDDEDDDYL